MASSQNIRRVYVFLIWQLVKFVNQKSGIRLNHNHTIQKLKTLHTNSPENKYKVSVYAEYVFIYTTEDINSPLILFGGGALHTNLGNWGMV